MDKGQDGVDGETADAMAALERQVRAPEGFVAASTGPEGGDLATRPQPVTATNPDALDIELDDD
jgi:pre-mRNA-splicing factor SYF1